ncbi:MAG: glycosyltransferase [Prevotellaceae bacterium]|nr:glycosyltransferase [Prevotellaceae bacterium]
MKVLLVNTSQIAGGAAIAAYRLLKALLRGGVDAKMLVALRQTDDPDVLTAAPEWRHKMHFATERARIWLSNGFTKKRLFALDPATDGTDITELPAFKEADIIHLHWVNQGFLSMAGLRKVLRSGKRIVWTMHDMWPSTGVCHYAGSCTLFRTRCHDCPLLKKPAKRDMSYTTFKRKAALYKDADFKVVTCSHWLEEQAHLSSLLKGKSITCIPNPLDTTLFCPGDKLEARKALGLPLERRLILFASQKVTDERKGIKYIAEMAKTLKKRSATQTDANLGFIAMGLKAERLAELLSYPVYPMGYIASPERLVEIYRAADLFITPALFDNLPNTIVEAMACGTPCVGFRTGGIPEMIDHLANGYVANYKDSQDLADGVEFVLNTPGLGDAASHYAQYVYDQDRVARKYIEVYAS